MRYILTLCLFFLPALAFAQSAATLVADSVTVDGEQRLIAQGNIEVFYDGTRLSAAQIIYDATADRLRITGPIFVQTADGTILTATQADLDPKLANGVLRSARLVLDQQLQLSANQIDRVAGRYSQLYKVAATSCQICGTRAPLWEIRSERVIHDAEAQQLYFENATLRLRGVPIIWIPRMRLPDPNLARATGLLIPQLRTTDQLGTGLKLPYFITMGPSRDLTLTPYASLKTTTLEARYRQAFINGSIEINAAASNDVLESGTRSYLFAEGTFALGNDYQLNFDIESTSDSAYLLDYGFSDKDRLDSTISILRVRNTDLFAANLTYFQTLRDDEVNASLPPLVGDLSYERRITDALGGVLTLSASADQVYRYASGTGAAARDLTRLGGSADWTRSWTLPNGILASGSFGLRADAYRINDDTAYANDVMRLLPSAGLVLRWPLLKTTGNGTAHLIEPTVAMAWSDTFGETPPNEDSTRAELDQANLLSFDHFPGDDVAETGTRVATGFTWTRLGAGGTNSTLTFGRIFRDTTNAAFTPSSGLGGTNSNWLIGGQIAFPHGFQLDGHALYNNDLTLTRTASQINWTGENLQMSAAYIWQAADATESRPNTVSEWTLDTTVQITDAWAISVDTRYDVANDRPARAGLGLAWQNECVTVDLSVSRRYTSSTTVDPSTDYGLSVSLAGFSAGRAGAVTSNRCQN